MHPVKRITVSAHTHAFTLIELIVSATVISLMLVLLVQLTGATQRTWGYTVGKIEQFREAREAFEAITRRLGQATLNTYWDYGYTSSGAGQVPSSYIRQSELRFISGSTQALGIAPDGNPLLRPTQAIFFQAPNGLVSDTADYHGLDNLLNTWGYCIEFGDDSINRPSFLSSTTHPPASRNRYRLMEFTEPSESFSLYQWEAKARDVNSNLPYTGKDWYTQSLGNVGALTSADGATRRPVHVLAENVVALIFLPELTKADQTRTPVGGGDPYTDASLSPFYLYDSTSTSNNSKTSPNPAVNADPNLNPKNQLPPVVQVTMVAVDEASYNRLQRNSTAPLNLSVSAKGGGGGNLFDTVGDTTNPQNPGYAHDLQTLQNNLQSYHLTYRVFTTSVSLKAAKWSRDQTN